MSCLLALARVRALAGLLLALSAGCQAHGSAAAPPPAAAPAPRPVAVFSGERLPPMGTRLTCPVCGDEFAIEHTLAVRHYQGKVVLLCCQRCLPHFDKSPELFAGPGI